MKLREQCADYLSQALGRKLTAKEQEEIVPALFQTMSRLRRERGEDFQRLPRGQQLAEAAAELSKNMQEQAQQVLGRAQMRIAAAERLQTIYANNAEKRLYGFRSVGRILEDVYRATRGVQQHYISRIAGELNRAIGSHFLGLFEDRTMAYALVQELRGEESRRAVAKQAAGVISKTFSDLRERFNAAGGDIGLLPDWALPQSHDAWRVRHAANRLSRNRFKPFNAAQQREAWVSFIMARLDRSRYENADGEIMDDDELRKMLEGVWQTLVTDGTGDDFGSRVAGLHTSRANRYSQHRALHFKDAKSYMEYEQIFGTGGVMSTIMGRVRSMSKDIALLEQMGPNPNSAFRTLKEIAAQDLKRARMDDSEWLRAWKYRDLNGSLLVGVDAMWSTLNGDVNTPAGTGLFAAFSQGVRNLQVAGKLGSAFISSLSDIPTYWVACGVNRINPLTAPFSMIRALGRGDREFAAAAGIMADEINSGLCRWYDDNVGNGLTSVLADLTIRASLLNGWTNMIRRAFSLNLMATTGRLIKRSDWGSLSSYDRSRFEQHGFTEKDYQILRLATPVEYRGASMLTRGAIEAISDEALGSIGASRLQCNQALEKWLSLIQDESYMASLEPDLATRAGASRGTQRGTIEGEFWRSFMLFKSFPFAMMTRHFERTMTLGRTAGTASAVAYAASVIVGTSIFGALSLQISNLIAGRDLQDVRKVKFWFNGMMKGGGLGVFGDMLYNGVFESGAYGSPNVLNFLGPVAGSAFDTWDVATTALGSALYDKETKWQQKAFRLVRGNTPFMNVWYAKTALDHAVFNDIQELLSPGYLRRQRQRAKRSQGQGYWWRQDEMLPSRAPRMATAPAQ